MERLFGYFEINPEPPSALDWYRPDPYLVVHLEVVVYIQPVVALVEVDMLRRWRQM